jgi:hypothetical protein
MMIWPFYRTHDIKTQAFLEYGRAETNWNHLILSLPHLQTSFITAAVQSRRFAMFYSYPRCTGILSMYGGRVHGQRKHTLTGSSLTSLPVGPSLTPVVHWGRVHAGGTQSRWRASHRGATSVSWHAASPLGRRGAASPCAQIYVPP